MKIGDLVKTNISRAGVPLGTLGLIIKTYLTLFGDEMCVVHMFDIQGPLIERRCLPINLEIINESR